MSIYTKKGDGGETGLPGSRRLSKTDPLFEILGALDNTNALIGLTLSLLQQAREKKLVLFLLSLQSDLLSIGSVIASEQKGNSRLLDVINKKTFVLESQIDSWESGLPELKNFVLPGGCQASSVVHLTRVSTRQTERLFHKLPVAHKSKEISRYLNRLSDYFFVCARYLNHRADKKDIIWKSGNNLSVFGEKDW